MKKSGCCSCAVTGALLLTTCRFVAGGALVIAAIMKMKDFSALMLSMKAFELVPEAVIPAFSYMLPWTEIVCGVLLVYGIWSRASAGVAALLYAVFTFALASVLARGMKVDCGCFGALTGGGEIDGLSIVRNLVFLAMSIAVMVRGGGATAIDSLLGDGVPASRLDRISSCPAPRETESAR